MADEFKSTAPKPFVFVLMPFAPEFDDIYNFGIKGAADDAEAYAERLDKQIFSENILERMYNQINKADVLVADMTGRNANVFYEVGYAHALGKVVLLLTKYVEDIPFDLIHYPHIVYSGSITQLRSELSKRLVWAIAESKKLDVGQNIERINVAVNNIDVPEISTGYAVPIVEITDSQTPGSTIAIGKKYIIDLFVSVYNIDSKSINIPLQLYLITECENIYTNRRIYHPSMDKTYGERTNIFDIGNIPGIPPKGVAQISVQFLIEEVILFDNKAHIAIHSNNSTYIFPFIMALQT